MINGLARSCPISGTKTVQPRQVEQRMERGVRGKAKPKEKKEMDQEQAAILIQKQVRGSLARKQYGSKVKAATGKLDEETIIFMKGWYKRWKLKSIFQVLLLYRATRHQDLVYFSQQAHLYNQNILSELKELNEEVGLKEIDPKAKASFLPPVRPAVHKLPFRLGDLPYFDSTYISDPARGIQSTHLRDTRDTDESWDAPLQRNIGEKYKRTAGSFNFREQGSQTSVDHISNPRGHNVSGYSLPETPFIREQGKMVKLPSVAEERRRDFKPKPSTDLGKNQVYRGSSVIRKPLKETPPPPPKDIIKGAKPTYGPIKEMQEKFRQNNGESDEPPFNFQAMLRKTENRRESLKRNGDGFNNNNNNIVFRSDNCNEGRVKKDDYRNRNVASSRYGKTKLPDNAIELAPGFVIHGEVADL